MESYCHIFTDKSNMAEKSVVVDAALTVKFSHPVRALRKLRVCWAIIEDGVEVGLPSSCNSVPAVILILQYASGDASSRETKKRIGRCN